MLNSVELKSFCFLEFYLEKNESGESSSMYTGTMRCELGDQNDHYYLCGDDDKDGKVYLLVSVE